MLELMLARGHAPRAELVEWMTIVGRCARSSTAPDRVERLPDPGQVLAAAGAQDIFLPPARLGPAVHDLLGVELHVVPQAGHLLIDERPDLVTRLLSTVGEQ